jgi:hypothetical protein
VTADPAAHQAFAHALARIEPPRPPGRVTVDMDHGHIWPAALPRLGWLVRGQPAWLDSTAPPTRAKRLFSVAVVRPWGRVITRRWAWCTPEMTAPLLAQGRRGLRGVRIALVLAHAPPQQGTRVEEALARGRMSAHR